MQTEIFKPLALLDEKGNINQPGFAKKLFWEYDRNAITAHKSRIKEWDYYYIANKKYALCVTIADMGYIGAISLTFIDFTIPTQFTNSSVFLFPFGKVNMPASSENGSVSWKNGGVEMNFSCDGKTRQLSGQYPNADKKGTDVTFSVKLSDIPEESMVVAIPFDKNGYFYYNQKINCMKAEGSMTLNDKVYIFDPVDSLATLDWGRGVWTYDNTWYWGSMQTRLEDGSTFGWNIGYGFGDTSNASEDMVFLNGISHKIGRTTINIPGDSEGKPNYMENWTAKSDDGRFEISFSPHIDRCAPINLKFMCMIPHQVFGYATGKCVLDDGKVVEFENVVCFIEKVHNKW